MALFSDIEDSVSPVTVSLYEDGAYISIVADLLLPCSLAVCYYHHQHPKAGESAGKKTKTNTQSAFNIFF